MGHFWDTMRFGTVDYFTLPMTVLLLIALALVAVADIDRPFQGSVHVSDYAFRRARIGMND